MTQHPLAETGEQEAERTVRRTSTGCRHPFTTWNERDGTLYCESCHSWVLPDDVAGVLDGRQRDRAGREGGQRGDGRREPSLPNQGAARPLTDPDPAARREYISVAFLEGGLDVPMSEDPVERWLCDG